VWGYINIVGLVLGLFWELVMSDDFEDLEDLEVSEDAFGGRLKDRRDRRRKELDDEGSSDDGSGGGSGRLDRRLDKIDARIDLNNSKAAKRKWLVFLILSLMGSFILLKFMLGF
jgi:hypothetical protein